ncbi:hypothetical protein E2542_SST09707 [Spatholobus suberectus]|nr:hypothetical protein E2542_SST09707 [Spatholobus suberectus]
MQAVGFRDWITLRSGLIGFLSCWCNHLAFWVNIELLVSMLQWLRRIGQRWYMLYSPALQRQSVCRDSSQRRDLTFDHSRKTRSLQELIILGQAVCRDISAISS